MQMIPKIHKIQKLSKTKTYNLISLFCQRCNYFNNLREKEQNKCFDISKSMLMSVNVLIVFTSLCSSLKIIWTKSPIV